MSELRTADGEPVVDGMHLWARQGGNCYARIINGEVFASPGPYIYPLGLDEWFAKRINAVRKALACYGYEGLSKDEQQFLDGSADAQNEIDAAKTS